jgi:hypothetical protein
MVHDGVGVVLTDADFMVGLEIRAYTRLVVITTNSKEIPKYLYWVCLIT